jgi:hypothetical protein
MIDKTAAQGGFGGIVFESAANDEQAFHRSEKVVIGTNDALVKLIAASGPSLLDDPRRLRAMLMS